jgi:hypothetical protein
MKLGRYRELFCRERWNIAVVYQSAQDIVRNGLIGRIRCLPTDPWAMMADPSCFTRQDGTMVLMAEHMDLQVGKGEIWSTVIPVGGDPANAVFRPWLTGAVHLSYPFPFADNGDFCLTAESWEAGNLYLWRQGREDWLLSRLIMNRPAVDATLWRSTDRWWLFCGFKDDQPDERLHLFYAERPEGPWSPHACNPVKVDSKSSRPAGPLFKVDGMIIRPAQDCSQTYGGAVVLNEVSRLDLETFSERPIRRLEPFDSRLPHGLHTICPAGPVTLIDGKCLTFHPFALWHKLLMRSRTHARCRMSHRRQPVPVRIPNPVRNSALLQTQDPPQTPGR